MQHPIIRNAVIIVVFLSTGLTAAYGQDRIYLTRGQILMGKVTEISPREVRFTLETGGGPVYVRKLSEIDSIVYANGKVDYFRARYAGYAPNYEQVNYHENIPQRYTWSMDALSLIQLSVTQSLELRSKDGMIGYRIPLYIGFIGGGIAGMGMFHSGSGVYYPFTSVYGSYDNYLYGGINGSGSVPSAGTYYGVNRTRVSAATGFNPKFYLIKHRIVRPFIGPEADIGYSVINVTSYTYDAFGNLISSGPKVMRCGTVDALARLGLTLNLARRFSLTVDGGAGVGDVFGSNNPIGLTGVWQIGLSMGVNF